MCGITQLEMASMAAEAGANFIRMFIWPNSKRSISLPVAKEISKTVKEYGAQPFGVFVNDAETILKAADAADLEFVQKEESYTFFLQNEDGRLLNPISDKECSLVDEILVDSATGQAEVVKGSTELALSYHRLEANKGGFWQVGLNLKNVSEGNFYS
ncbi:N-(5'phosphoribosyl) anthranilate isomerase (PRAI) domain [Dillenia turbinata]|uniref:N-(5'phosphoribosyl) anthranilate isomerase (PRAI) domain n=1 Tax=Dillenia turbinata TaxID=194707 RepID=A0AAN8VHH1_9MAGN